VDDNDVEAHNLVVSLNLTISI